MRFESSAVVLLYLLRFFNTIVQLMYEKGKIVIA